MSFNMAFSGDDRGSPCPDDMALDAVIKIVWFHTYFILMEELQ